jgi:energy-coupling factor transporter ATP-binding protein EcfA2
LTALVRELAAGGTAVLAITHDREFVNDACDRVITMRAGRIVADLPLGGGLPAVDALLTAGVPLADVPATVRYLADRGILVAARTVDDLAEALR